MNNFKAIFICSLLSLPATGLAQTGDPERIRPDTGQPAADVLGSHDIWGNPTFIGGITNKGPDSQSTW